jgi:4-alpha-glucanotransferase
MREDGFAWWIARLRANLRLADVVRVDHFRGLVAYWEVAANETTAKNGRWVEGPGAALLEAARRALCSLPIVAEDLGLITPEVRTLREAFSLPGMKVLQFAFGEENSDHLPHHHEPRSVVYTGTHDNDTARGWFRGLAQEDRARALDYLGSSGEAIERDLLRAAYASVAEIAIVPVQDVLGLGSEARMNVPGRADGNWGFRAEAAQLDDGAAARLRRLASLTGRLVP